ncbi:MAG: portal protein, partial [Beijerinckiaceae bacterium]
MMQESWSVDGGGATRGAAMSEDSLRTHIAELERQAIGYYSGEIAVEQAMAMDYYLRKPFGTEEEGRSQVVSSDVWDVVEGLTPLVLKPFVSSDDVVSFRPHGPEDEEAAAQETDYLNFIVTQRNDNFEQLVAWVKTGLLQKNGVVKWWWDASKQTSLERVTEVPDDVFAAILQEPGVEVVEHSEDVGPDGVALHSAVLRVSNEGGRPCYEVVPPEEFLVGRDARSVNPAKARFFQHRRKVTLSQLREWGYDVEDGVADGAGDESMSPVNVARNNAEESSLGYNEGNDPSSREVTFKETY